MRMTKSSILFFFSGVVWAATLLLAVASAQKVRNSRPIVGVMAQPTYADPQYKGLGRTYLAAAYVKWLESAGARVVAIQYDLPQSELVRLLQSINAVVFPGGELDIPGSQYGNVSQFIYNWATKENDAGNHFTLWGTCQGFEQMAMMASGDDHILSHFDSENLTLALSFTQAAYNSRLFGSMEKRVVDIFRTQPVSENLHQLGLAPNSFFQNERIRTTWDILSTNQDRKGKEFVSSMEAKRYPFYASQFHPERNAYEWDRDEALIHSADAVAAMQAIANFIVSEARKSAQTFANKDDEYKKLIYNFAPLYTPHIDRYYEQVYFWHSAVLLLCTAALSRANLTIVHYHTNLPVEPRRRASIDLDNSFISLFI